MRTIRITMKEKGGFPTTISKREKQSVSFAFLIGKGKADAELETHIRFKGVSEGGTEI